MNCTLKVQFPEITLGRGAVVVVPFGLAIGSAIAQVDDNQQELRAEVTVYQDGVYSNSHLYRLDLGMPLYIKLVLVHHEGKRFEISRTYIYHGNDMTLALVYPSVGEHLSIEGRLEEVIEKLVTVLLLTAAVSLQSVDAKG